MRKKSGRLPPSRPGSQNSPFSTLLDAIDPERESQRQGLLNRKRGDAPKASPRKPEPERRRKPKARVTGFDERLERTNRWLQETFPDLFDPSRPKPLDVHIVRDIKARYRNERVARKYPDDLVIKAALYRYMESPGYLDCLVDGAPRHNIDGEVSGSV